MNQGYDAYTATDQFIWRTLYERQMDLLKDRASRAWLDGVDKAGFVADHIPDFEKETNPRLRALTGWEVYAVPGLIPHKEFYTHLAHKQFPASTWLRNADSLDYLEEPDMFHDTFGHVPLLTNADFCNFMTDISRIALKFIDNPFMLERLSRLYWYTVEFGLIKEQGMLKIYGGGILSSSGESVYCLEKEVRTYAFDVHAVLNTPYAIDKFQSQYFVIDGYAELYEGTRDLKHTMDALADGSGSYSSVR